MQQGPLAPRALPRFVAAPGLAATVSPSADFPGAPVIRLTCSTDCSMGRGRFLQLLDMPLPPLLSLPPRRSDMPHRSARAMPCCLRPNLGQQHTCLTKGCLSLSLGGPQTKDQKVSCGGDHRYSSLDGIHQGQISASDLRRKAHRIVPDSSLFWSWSLLSSGIRNLLFPPFQLLA